MTYELTPRVMGRIIGEALQADGLTQAEFAGMVGCSPKHLNQVITGKAFAQAATLDYWAFVLGRRWSVTLKVAE